MSDGREGGNKVGEWFGLGMLEVWWNGLWPGMLRMVETELLLRKE